MTKRSVFIIVLIFILTGFAFAQRGTRASEVLEVKLGSPLPKNSDWGRTLDRIAGEWSRVTNGEVRLRVMHDGAEGTDAAMLSSLSSNSIQGALLTSSALISIIPEIMTLSAPFLIRNSAEFDLVLKDVLPGFDDKLKNTNYVVVAWSNGGWVYIISSEPVFTPDDLRRLKIGSSTELKDLNTTFKTMGFNLIEVDMVEMAKQLADRSINSIYLMPEAIVPLGLHQYLSYFQNLPIAPFVGAIVINRVTWNKISAQNQRELIRVTQRIATEFDASMARTSANAINALRQNGFQVNTPTQAQIDLWHTDINRVIPSLLGTTLDRDLYNRVNRLLENYRNGR